MGLDGLVLYVQSLIDRLVRRLRLGQPPRRTGRRLLIVQIDGLSRAVLEQAIGEGRMPFLRKLLARRRCRLTPMTVGMPTSTPSFQMSAMYGVRPDIPGFHYHDKRRQTDVYFPRAGDAAFVEANQAAGRRGIVTGGSTYGCVFTGGATNNLFSFAMFKRPTRAGLLPVFSALLVLAWVFAKSVVLTLVELMQWVLRLVAKPFGNVRDDWKWLALKVGLSIWIRELFTLSVSRDVYAGVPAIYVNYLDYDVLAHAFGPRHRRALRGLRFVDGSLRQLWRVARRVPEHRYDLYILSDHGQVHCRPYQTLTGGAPIERRLFDEFFAPLPATEVSPGRRAAAGRRIASGIKAFRSHREPGIFQRFVNYLERDFPARLERRADRAPESFQGGDVRIVAAGPNAFVYFLDRPEPLTVETIDERRPGLVEEISRAVGVGLVLVRSATGPVCAWRGKRYRLGHDEPGPFAGRADLDVVVSGIADLMAMPSAGDLVIYGHQAMEGDVSFVDEIGAHAGPSEAELHTFIISPASVELPAPIHHPVQLYQHFVKYQRGVSEAA
jgi:hypothetical protein